MSLARGIVGKELRLLFRDRNFMVQTLVLPLLLVGFQLFMGPGVLEASGRHFRHGAMLAFGIGAYVLVFGGFSILTVEAKSLWLLYTFPRSMAEMLRRKAGLWAGVSALYVVSILGVVGANSSTLDLTFLGDSLMALVGIVIYAFIACGMGVLGTNPLAEEARQKARPGVIYLYMLLAAMYGYGIYTPTLWNKIALVVLCALVAYAIWQKVRDRLPYLLDPTDAPAPRIALSDGLIAALVFFVVQGILLAVLMGVRDVVRGFPFGGAIVIAFVTAGVIVVLASLLHFWWAKVPDFAVTLGLRPALPGDTGFRKAVLTGLCFGLVAALFGLAYVQCVEFIPPLRQLKESVELDLSQGVDLRWWLAALAILAAPLFEEFIFRGLVFRGLRRTLPLATSVLASAGIFAVVHPPISVIPVFVLGIVTALSFERTGLLAAPIAAHMIYNTAVLSAGHFW